MGRPGVAIGMPATRRSLRRRWLIVAALGIAAAGSLGLAGWKGHVNARARALQHDGVQADATVVAVDARTVGRARMPNGSVRVRFDANGRSWDSSVYVAGAVGDYQPDQVVRVVYDASDPARVELLGATTSRRGVPGVLLLVVGVVLAAMALIAGRHVHRIARVVRNWPWQPIRSSLVQVPQTIGFRQGSRTLVVLDTPGGPVTVEAVDVSRVDPTFAPEAWVAGLGAATPRNDTTVLAAPGGGHVVAVRRR